MFKKPSGKKGNTRKREITETTVDDKLAKNTNNNTNNDNYDDDDDDLVFKPEKKHAKLLEISSTNSKLNSIANNLVSVTYSSSGKTESIQARDMGATSISEIDTDISNDALARLKKTFEIQSALKSSTATSSITSSTIETGGDEIYKGQSSYLQYRPLNEKELKSKIRIGPSRASSNIRVTARFDYQPDVCKDYKETGYCGYGDSCKFLHDRGDYKAGWQIDRDWENEMKRKREAELEKVEDDDEEKGDEGQGLPFACLICRNEFTLPVRTKCGHYFCESCAIGHFGKSPKCFACGAATEGIFNIANEIIRR